MHEEKINTTEDENVETTGDKSAEVSEKYDVDDNFAEENTMSARIIISIISTMVVIAFFLVFIKLIQKKR